MFFWGRKYKLAWQSRLEHWGSAVCSLLDWKCRRGHYVMCYVIRQSLEAPQTVINSYIQISITCSNGYINVLIWMWAALRSLLWHLSDILGALICYLGELNQGVLEVFEVSLERLRCFLPVLQGAALNIASILQVLQLSFDPGLGLHHKQTTKMLKICLTLCTS